ncbi:MAG: hypothetical protein PHN31_05750 [Candidatus Gracilibacteria bacterium]|nr:hypothetical protein [Candidatus Gracilibacteria bacterium]
MVKLFINNFKKLPLSNKAMVYLMWIYAVGSVIAMIFVNIYVFKIHNSFKDIIFYNLTFFTFNLIGFSFVGWIMSLINKDIKNMYYIGYVFFTLSFIALLIFNSNIFGTYIFGILYGLGNGTFRCAVHTQELKNIKDENRDFYSSSISAGRNILQIITPLIISGIFYLGDIFNFDGYLVLFLMLPLLYISSFFIINNIDSYTPNKITLSDLKNFFCFKKYKYGHIYFLFGGGIIRSFELVLIPIISIVLLKNEINIGLFQGILTLISTYVVINLSFKRNTHTRLKYYFIICFLLFLTNFVFGIIFSLTFFILFSLANIFLSPIFRVSEHVYDLALMDSIKTEKSDFFPAMILREIVLWIGRMLSLIMLYVLLFFTKIDTNEILQSGLLIRGLFLLILPFTILLWEKYEKNLV